MTYLDTHATAWMYAGRVELFPPPVRELLASEELLFPRRLCDPTSCAMMRGHGEGGGRGERSGG